MVSNPLYPNPTKCSLQSYSPRRGFIHSFKASFPSTTARFSVSTSTTSTNTTSSLMPATPVLNDSLLSSPAFKNAVFVPVLSHAYAYEGFGLIRRDGNFREHVPLSRSKTYDDEDLEADAKYYYA